MTSKVKGPNISKKQKRSSSRYAVAEEMTAPKVPFKRGPTAGKTRGPIASVKAFISNNVEEMTAAEKAAALKEFQRVQNLPALKKRSWRGMRRLNKGGFVKGPNS